MNRRTIYIIIAIFVLIIILGLGIWYFVKQKESQPEEEVTQREVILSSDGANWTPEQNRNLQQGLVNITGKYLDAVLATNAVFLTDIENTTYEEWQEKLSKAIVLWEELEQLEKEMDIVFNDLGIPESNLEEQTYLSNYHLASLESFFIPSVYAITKGKGIPELGAVTAVFDSVPHGQKLRRIMEVFGWDRKTAFYHLKREQGLMESEAWDKAGDTYKRWETAARAIKDASKVTVFVGANIISAGGAGAAVGAFQATTMVIGGVSLAIEVGEDVNIAIGNEENAAALRQALEKAKPITEIVSIISLKDIGDPGNLFYIADKAGQLYDAAKEGYLYLIKDEKTGKVIVTTEKPEGLKVPEPDPDPEKSKTAGLPEGKYRIGGEGIEVKEEKKPEGGKEPEEPAIEDINDIAEIAGTLAELEIPEKPTVAPQSTKIKTGETNNLNIDIPEGFTGPFDVEYIDVGGSGAGVVLPSETDSRNFTGEFISSNPGTFVVEIKITDADGKVYTTKTTISVEGEPPVEETTLEGEVINLSGTVSVNSVTYPLPGIDPRTHKLKGSGTINISIIGDQVTGSCNISAKDYWRCPPEAECGDDWLPSAAAPVNILGPVTGTFYPSTGRIEAQVGEHSLTGTLSGSEASGKFYYELPSGQPAFYWSATAQ